VSGLLCAVRRLRQVGGCKSPVLRVVRNVYESTFTRAVSANSSAPSVRTGCPSCLGNFTSFVGSTLNLEGRQRQPPTWR
jgi:hypothetical protein